MEKFTDFKVILLLVSSLKKIEEEKTKLQSKVCLLEMI